MKRPSSPGDRKQWGWEVRVREEWAEMIHYARLRWGL